MSVIEELEVASGEKSEGQKIAESTGDIDTLKIKIREIATEIIPIAELQHIIRHEMEEFIWRTIFRDVDKQLREIGYKLTPALLKDKLSEMTDERMSKIAEKTIDESLKETLREKVRSYIEGYELRSIIINEIREVANSIIKEAIDARKDEIQQLLKDVVAQAGKDFFTDLVAERIRVLVSSLERGERRLSEIEMKVSVMEHRVSGR